MSLCRSFRRPRLKARPRCFNGRLFHHPLIDTIDDGDVITVPGPEMGPLPNS